MLVRTAHAESPQQRSMAEALFQEGRRLMSEERYDEACPKLEESQRLDPGGGTLLNVAVCHERIGRTATAWSEYREALAQARRDQRPDRQEYAQARLNELEPKLSYVIVRVPEAARVPGLRVLVGNVALGDGSWGTPLPVDPGTVTVLATAPDRRPFRRELQIAAQERSELEVPVLVPVQQAQSSEPKPPSAVPAESQTLESRRHWGIGIGLAGAASIAAGAFFGVWALHKKDQSDELCPNERCSVEGVNLNEDARLFARLSNLGFGLGLVGVGAASYLVLTSSDRGATTSSVRLQPQHGGSTVVFRSVW